LARTGRDEEIIVNASAAATLAGPRRGLAPAPADEVGATRTRGWFAALSDDDPSLYSYLLALRFGVVNLIALVLLGAAWLKGWLTSLVISDTTHLVAAIAGVFVVGFVLCARTALQISGELNQVRARNRRPSSRVASYLASIAGRDGQSRAILASTLKLKLASRIAPIRHVANSLVITGVDPEAAADVSSIGPMVSTLIDGMSVALHTTLVGSVLNVWLMLNYRLVESGSVRLLTAIVELGEHRG
jgi:hypothetical protein